MEVLTKCILADFSYKRTQFGFLALESLHCRATKLIFGLTRDMPTTEVLKTAKWHSLHFMYKVKLVTLAYKIFHNRTPPSMGHILTKKISPIYHLRTKNKVTVPRLNTYYFYEKFNSIQSLFCVESPHPGFRKDIQC